MLNPGGGPGRAGAGALALAASVLAVGGAAPPPAHAVPKRPAQWPRHLVLGLAEGPGHTDRLDARYQYLSGGVNTGAGWASWNPGARFVSRYVRESLAARMIPVFSYYQLLQSRPSRGADEARRDLSNLRNRATMRAYWSDFSLMLRRIRGASRGRLAVVHLEPDLWGYLQAAHAVGLARRFARRARALRNRLAPRVALAWHLSVWGTGEDPTYTKPSLAHADTLAASSAVFYRSLRTRFDLVFNDVSDRDAGFYRVIGGNPRTAWDAGDFRRHRAYLSGFVRRTRTPVVLWQLPLGNSTLNDTWRHFRDNRVQWWLDDTSGEHLRAERAAGVIGLLFGGGADGTTDVRNDGGVFFDLARRYLAGPLALP